MMQPTDPLPQPAGARVTATFDLHGLASAFPDSAETMLLDTRLTNEPAASARLFRVYRPVPAHYHKTCDEYLQVITGRARFVVGGNAPVELGPAGPMPYPNRNQKCAGAAGCGLGQLVDLAHTRISVLMRRHIAAALRSILNSITDRSEIAS